MSGIVGSDQLEEELFKPRDTHGVEYDDATNCIVFTHMYENPEEPKAGGYDVDLGSFKDVKTTLQELEHLCKKPKITKDHLKEFLRLALKHVDEELPPTGYVNN